MPLLHSPKRDPVTRFPGGAGGFGRPVAAVPRILPGLVEASSRSVKRDPVARFPGGAGGFERPIVAPFRGFFRAWWKHLHGP